MQPIITFAQQLLSPVLQDYLRTHENDDVQKLLLKSDKVDGVPVRYIAQMIAGRQKIKHKLPSWWTRTDLLYPPSVNLEQASSEATARFKSNLLAAMASKHERAADLTGGFGIDSFFLSKTSDRFDYVERDPQLFEITSENFRTLHAENIETHLTTSEDFLNSLKEDLDYIYIDPSRRKASQKVYRLADCEPDMTKLQRALFTKTDLVMVKASPVLDIQQGISELNHVTEVYVVASDNECKELLFVMRKEFRGEVTIKAIDLDSDGSVKRGVSFRKSDEVSSIIEYSPPLKFIYEPSPSILKAGAFKWISNLYMTPKLAPNTHLYTSDTKVNFPGRTFRVLGTAPLDKKLRAEFINGHANIIARNYPLSVEEIKKKTGLKEGGERYLICTQDQKKKFVLIAERI